MRWHWILVAVVSCSEEPDLKDTKPIEDTGPASDTAPAVDTAPPPCPPPMGAPVEHSGTIDADETWGAGEHIVKFSVGVRQNATLILEGCAVVYVAAGQGISVGSGNIGDGGTLIARGTAARPVIIRQRTEAWADILVNQRGRIDLAYTTISGGGAAASRAGAVLHLYGDQFLPVQALARVSNVTIENSGKYGVVTEGHGAFDLASDALTIRGSKQNPMFVTAPSLGSIPPGTYTENGVPAIRVSGTAAYEILDSDVTIHDRGVPYTIGGEGRFGELSVVGKDGTVPTLTLEAGVTMKFIKKGGLFIERATGTFPAKGALVIKGTAGKPVVLTSDEPAPAAGDWSGVWFGGVPAAKNSIDHARIEYAGGATGTLNASCGTPLRADPNRNEAAVLVLGVPTKAFITNSTFLKSAANGIERAWRGTAISFLPTNTFTDVAYCHETTPKDDMGACPTPIPCPR